MGIQIEDGTGSGVLAAVNDENLLKVISVSGSVAGHLSLDDGTVFSVFGTSTVSSGVVIPITIVNNDPSLVFIIDRVFVEGTSIGGGTAIPNQSAFFSLGYNRTVTSGGVSLTPVNLNRTAVTIANITATGSNPNMTGTFVESHRWYIQANGIAFDMVRPEDDFILGRTNTMEVRYSSDNTSGTVFAQVKFLMARSEELP